MACTLVGTPAPEAPLSVDTTVAEPHKMAEACTPDKPLEQAAPVPSSAAPSSVGTIGLELEAQLVDKVHSTVSTMAAEETSTYNETPTSCCQPFLGFALGNRRC